MTAPAGCRAGSALVLAAPGAEVWALAWLADGAIGGIDGLVIARSQILAWSEDEAAVRAVYRAGEPQLAALAFYLVRGRARRGELVADLLQRVC